jgi:CRP/FNR family transcriptional regulator, anaerobic regulatory protein
MLTAVRFPFLSELSAEGLQALAELPTTRVEPAQVLLQRGDPVDGAFLIVGGSLRAYYITSEGREATLYRVESGETCVLALTSAINRKPYPAWVDAGTQGGSLVRVPGAMFTRMLDDERAFRHFVFGALAGRVFELMQTLEETGSAQIEQRVARFLLRRMDSDGAVRATQSGIASELGTAREVVFRALRALSARNVVVTGRNRIQIIDARELARIANAATLEKPSKAT